MDNLKLIIENIKAKNLDLALNQCDEFCELKNEHIINNLKGVIYSLKKEIKLAEDCFIKSHKLLPNFEDPIKNLYLIYLKNKNFKSALIYGYKLYELNILNDLYSYQLAYVYELNNNLKLAIDFYIKCINLNGSNKVKALNNIGGIYLRNNKNKTSLKFFLEGEKINHKDKIIINNLLLNYIKLKNEKKANEYFKKAESIDNKYIEFIYNKAEYLILRGQYDNAEKILIENKKYLKFLIILISLYFNKGEKDKGKLLLDNSLDEIKKDVNFFNYLGLRLLYEGNFDDGWKYYEYRGSKLNNLISDTKEWNGENLERKKIVVFSEQGLGDAIQFSKYLIPLSKKCNDISFVVKKNIYTLFKSDDNKIKIETYESIKDEKFDFKISLGSLIKFFYNYKFNNSENIIFKNREKIKFWKEKLNKSKPNVGLVWSGSFYGPNQPLRSIPLKSLNKIFKLDINYYSLQNEVWDRDKEFLKDLNIYDFGIYDLSELISIIENLDLVISADTSLLHLSASLNKETWGIFNIYPDWRWGAFDKINPYDSLIKINQTKFNNWDDVTNKIYLKLKDKFKLN